MVDNLFPEKSFRISKFQSITKMERKKYVTCIRNLLFQGAKVGNFYTRRRQQKLA